jgi:hypothetical protein
MRAGRAHVLELLRTLRPIAERIDLQCRQDGLLGEVRALLPLAERPHCLLAATRRGVLTLSVDSAAWATRLRYRIPDLLSALQAKGVASIKMQIQPPGKAPVGFASRNPMAGCLPRGGTLSEAAADHLLLMADQATDPGIGEAFRRLARRRRLNGSPS